MCAHYEGVNDPQSYTQKFGALPHGIATRSDLWPGYMGTFVRRHPHVDVGDDAVPDNEALPGVFGLLPHWAKDTKLARHTYNARSETVAEKPSFRDAWRRRRHCIIPAAAIYEPDWSSGRAVPTRITRADGEPMGLAGLWDAWKQADGSWLHSYTMLTINADDHAFMRRFHKPDEEKRMVVILPEWAYADWLAAQPDSSREFLRPYPAEALTTAPAPGTTGDLLG